MNRLWIRLSLMMGGVVFLVFFIQFLSIVLDPGPDLPDPGQLEGPAVHQAPPDEITRRLFEWMAFSALVGLVGGVVISRVISAPVSDLVKAARKIGEGDLKTRVPERGSQEMIDLAATFNKMAAELQRAETLRSNLMADVSHELRTPLTVLEGNLRAALDSVYPLDEAEIANLYSQTHHLIRLVSDLRELSLAETHQLPLEIQPTDLNSLLSETIQALEPLASDKEIQLRVEMADLSPIPADPQRIRQVFFNLLSNGLRHTPPGGIITIRAQRSDHQICLEFCDTGDGLEREQIPAVFDRFYRGDKSRSRDTGGAGLGLAIVKAIVEAHGGRVEAQSAGKGKGSRFLVSLPGG